MRALDSTQIICCGVGSSLSKGRTPDNFIMLIRRAASFLRKQSSRVSYSGLISGPISPQSVRAKLQDSAKDQGLQRTIDKFLLLVDVKSCHFESIKTEALEFLKAHSPHLRFQLLFNLALQTHKLDSPQLNPRLQALLTQIKQLQPPAVQKVSCLHRAQLHYLTGLRAAREGRHQESLKQSLQGISEAQIFLSLNQLETRAKPKNQLQNLKKKNAAAMQFLSKLYFGTANSYLKIPNRTAAHLNLQIALLYKRSASPSFHQLNFEYHEIRLAQLYNLIELNQRNRALYLAKLEVLHLRAIDQDFMAKGELEPQRRELLFAKEREYSRVLGEAGVKQFNERVERAGRQSRELLGLKIE